MIVQVPTEVVPVWFIERWKKENADSESPLEFFIDQLVYDWHMEELKQSGTTSYGKEFAERKEKEGANHDRN